MTKHKQTKRALISSMLSLVLCFTMLLGTTFAWFTDSASTAVNKIQSGTLNVALLDEAGNTLEGQLLSWKKAAGHESEEVLWEPGATYELQPITIKNNGNLALKYQVIISGILGDAMLNDVIDWSIEHDGNAVDFESDFATGGFYLTPNGTDDDADTLVIKGTMSTEAGNEYQNKSIEGIAITVVATQYTYEYDSNNNTYDERAEYPTVSVWDGETTTAITPDAEGVYHITSAAEFVEYITAIGSTTNSSYTSASAVLECDIDLAGYTITRTGTPYGFFGTFDGQNHTVKNFTMTHTDTELYTGLFGYFSALDGSASVKNLIVENATVIGNSMVGVITGNVEDNAVVENCHVKNSTVIANNKKAGAIAGYTSNGTVTECSATNVNVYCANANVNESGEIVGYVNAGSTVENNYATNVNVYRNTTITTPIANGVVQNTDGEYLISNAAGLQWFAAQVNEQNNQFLGKTVALTADVDLVGIDWTPIGNNDSTIFIGTFNGNGHTIKNLTVNDDHRIDKFSGVGFFGWLNGYVNDVVFDNATVNGSHNVGVLAGYQQFGQIKNVTVKNSTVTGTHVDNDLCGDKIGGIVGVSYNTNHNDATNTDVDMINCKVENTTVKGGRDTGMIAGAANYVDSTRFSGCVANNVTLGTTTGCTGANIGACLRGLVGRDI